MNCPVCNAEIQPYDTICPFCKSPVIKTEPAPQQTPYGAPQQTGYVQPGYGAPQQTGYVQPGYPQTGYVQPGYGAPQQTGYVQPGYGAPQQTGYVQPGYPQTGYVQPGYGAPQQTGYVQPGYGVPQQPAYVPKSKVAYQLLAFFIGGIGVHDFYAGHKKNGIIHLCLWIVVMFLYIVFIATHEFAFLLIELIISLANWIWALVQLFTVKNDGDGNPMI